VRWLCTAPLADLNRPPRHHRSTTIDSYPPIRATLCALALPLGIATRLRTNHPELALQYHCEGAEVAFAVETTDTEALELEAHMIAEARRHPDCSLLEQTVNKASRTCRRRRVLTLGKPKKTHAEEFSDTRLGSLRKVSVR